MILRLKAIFSNAKDGFKEELLKTGNHFRHEKWTESVAVESALFVEATKERLGVRAKGREVIGGDGSYELRESPVPYKGILGHENSGLSHQNEYFWEDLS